MSLVRKLDGGKKNRHFIYAIDTGNVAIASIEAQTLQLFCYTLSGNWPMLAAGCCEQLIDKLYFVHNW
ncbi:hypothetical protein GCM10023189_60490 [Nibrella saemangeumensis]|uniref:Transposase n=1 Tax=Nibrella saemangeumensis TaxID=1084526 RepID=A0ABP8NTN1_9BACT